MDKYDYVTATIEEEKVRLEKIITHLKENNLDEELIEVEERYNNILRYLNAKKKYLNIEDGISNAKEKLSYLNKIKDEYEVDNILLEDTLLSKFHEDTLNIYTNMLYENIKYEDEETKNLLYLLFEKQSSYTDIIEKRNKIINILDSNKYPKTYNTLVSQSIIIEKQKNIQDEIFLLENGIKIKEKKQNEIKEEITTIPILKLLYEFWIVDSYDINKVNKDKLFKDNRTLVSIKSAIFDKQEESDSKEKEEVLIPNLNLPGLNEDTLINIEGKNYVKSDK